MNINDALSRLLPIAKTNAATMFSGIVSIRNGRAECYDGRMLVSYPVPVDVSICVAAEPLAKATKADSKFTIKEDKVVISTGRSRVTLKLLDVTTVPSYEPHEDLRDIPAGCLEDWARARKFASANAAHGWATSVMARGRMLLSTNNVVLSCLTMEHPTPVEGLIPSYLIDYVMSRAANGEAQEMPVKAGGDINAITLQWADGAYVRAQRVLGKPHEQLFEVAANLRPAETLVGDDWREAYEAVLPFAETTIAVSGSDIFATRAELDAEGQAERSIGDAVLDPRYFTPVLEESTHIELHPHPGRSVWSGDRIVGILAGRAHGV